MSSKKISSERQLHAYQYQTVVLQITGNSNQIILENCAYQILVTGNGNKIIIIQNGQQSLGKDKANILTVVGNDNNVGFGGGNLRLKLTGNCNQIEGETQGLVVTQINGFGNIVPECAIQKKVIPEKLIFNKPSKEINFNQIVFPPKIPQFQQEQSFNSSIFQNNQTNQKLTHNNFNFMQNPNQNFMQNPKNPFSQNPNINPFFKNNYDEERQKQKMDIQRPQQINNFAPYIYGNRNAGLNFGKKPNEGNFQNQGQFGFPKKTNSLSHKNINVNNPRPNPKPQPRPQVTNKYEIQDPVPLSQQQLIRLQKSKHIGKSINCNICLQDITSQHQEIYLFCFHSYHSKCILDWFRKSSKCPFCFCDVRKQIKEAAKYN